MQREWGESIRSYAKLGDDIAAVVSDASVGAKDRDRESGKPKGGKGKGSGKGKHKTRGWSQWQKSNWR